MPSIDLRTYVLLERAFVRRLQRTWRQQSAETYAKITQACLNHQWDEARRLVSDLDMTEVGSTNREWIQYMLLSCAVFGASIIAKKKPSFVGVGTFDTFLKQTTKNMLQYLEHQGTRQVQAEALQSIAEDEAKTKAIKWDKWDEAKHPRDKEGQFTEGKGYAVEDAPDGVINITTPEGFVVLRTRRAKGATQDAPIPKGYAAVEWIEATGEGSGRGEKLFRDALTVAKRRNLKGLASLVSERNYESNRVWERMVAAGAVTTRVSEKGVDYDLLIAMGTTQKWDEALHPRDKIGQFAPSAEARQPGEEPFDIEGGGGPERKEWQRLNQAASDAGDAEYAARSAHTEIAFRLEHKYPEGTPFTDYEDADFVAYDTSRKKALEAGYALEKAEEALKLQAPRMKIEVVTNLANSVAKELGVHPWHLNVVDKDPREFMVGDKKFTEGGHYSSGNEQIEINVRELGYGDAAVVKGIAAHELSHFIYHTMKSVADREFQRYLAKATTPDGKDRSAWYWERFEKDAPDSIAVHLKPQYREEMAKEFPASAVLAKLSQGEIFRGLTDEMIKENGHSAYAKSYWEKESIREQGGYEAAINETTAELTRYITHPRSWHENTAPKFSSPWMTFTGAMHQWYRERQARIEAAMAKTHTA